MKCAPPSYLWEAQRTRAIRRQFGTAGRLFNPQIVVFARVCQIADPAKVPSNRYLTGEFDAGAGSGNTMKVLPWRDAALSSPPMPPPRSARRSPANHRPQHLAALSAGT